MGNYNRQKDLGEAIATGECALQSLKEAQQYLKKASVWGFVDIFGGGAIVDWIKHSKIDQASNYIIRAQDDLREFQKEVGDVLAYEKLSVDISKFLAAADFICDDFIADVMVQSKIKSALDKINKAIPKVEKVLQELESL